MKQYYPVIANTKLFAGIDLKELAAMINCLSATKSEYKKGAYIYRFGDHISSVGLVLSGQILISKDDYWGNRTIISELNTGMMFGESYSCFGSRALSVNVTAATDCVVLFLDVNRILTTCPSSCTFHAKLIQNLVMVLAEKNLMLNGKIEHLSQRKLRDKLLSYLSAQSKLQSNACFTIPFNRQELADYLCVDRSAMSNELSKLQDEGIITFHKNEFTLL